MDRIAGVTRKFEPSVTLRTAHDVRKLRGCQHCQQIGDVRFMLTIAGKLVHGGCALELVGVDGLLALPIKDQDRLTLGEIGSKAMRAIVASRESA
jgi:hypothetical protein